ncbi:hypothetical protein NBRC110019_20660 [Neptunitalea chrysea]|uniref:Uncharacterized protein n=2 Tax=Neptunitalea chrysea TaxID=1647581 RepID=A0A9W6B583_9FLAO|nr:hypothetical protein NBRC110019_20660 [Neptunitalea chrysea]
MRSAKNFEARLKFYKFLLKEELYTVIDEEQSKVADPFSSILKLKNGKLPVFTSKERIYDSDILKETVSYIRIKGRDLFTKTQGATFELNPFSDYGKELTPKEISQLLDGSIFDNLKANSNIVSIQNDDSLVLYVPKKQPQEMLTSLQNVAKGFTEINTAYIGGIRFGEEEQPHWILGLDCESCIERASKKLELIAMSYLTNHVLEIMDINQNEGIRDYLMANTVPFYTKVSE